MKMGTYANRCYDQEDGAQNCGGQNQSVQLNKCVKYEPVERSLQCWVGKAGLESNVKVCWTYLFVTRNYYILTILKLAL